MDYARRNYPSSKPPRHKRVAIVGTTSSTKSSLNNALIGSNVCQRKTEKTTDAISIFTHGTLNRNNENDAKEIKRQFKEAKENIKQRNQNETSDKKYSVETFPILFEGYCHPVLKSANIELVDTPGMFEVSDTTSWAKVIDSPRYTSLKEQLSKVDVCVILVTPREVEAESTKSLLAMVNCMTYDYIIALSKCDEVTLDTPSDDSSDDDNVDIVTDVVQAIDTDKVQKLLTTLETKFHCPVVPLSLTQLGKQTFPLEDYLLQTIQDYFENPCTYIQTKKRVLAQLESDDRYPLNQVKDAEENWKERNKVLLPVIVGGTVLAGGALVTTGVVLVVVIPGLGTGAGGAAIMSGLAAFGFGGALGGVATTSVLSTGVGVAVGGLSFVGTHATQRLIMSRLATSIQSPDLDIAVAEHEMTRDKKQSVLSYLESGGDWMLYNRSKYCNRAYKDGDLYLDTTFVQVDDEIYYVAGMFRRRKLMNLVGFAKIRWV